MAFEIDTGTTLQTARSFVPGYVTDFWTPPDYTDAQIVQCYAHHLMGEMKDKKRFETIRKMVAANWGFLSQLMTENPGLFDEFWLSYSERWQELA
jgi:hypothetical protein